MGIARTDDAGMTWRELNTKALPETVFHQILCIEDDTNIVLAMGANYGLNRSTNGGRTWQNVLEQGSDDGETIVYDKPTRTLYFCRRFASFVHRSTDMGLTWTQVYTPESIKTLCTIAKSPFGSTILAGSGEGSVARTTDFGATWEKVLGQEGRLDSTMFVETPKIVYSVHSPGTALAANWNSKHRGLMITRDDGLTWTRIGEIAQSTNTDSKYPGTDRLYIDSLLPWALDIDQDPSRIVDGMPQHFFVGLFNTYSDTISRPVIQETTDGGRMWSGSYLHYERKGISRTSQQVWVLKHDVSSGTTLAATFEGVFMKRDQNSGVSLSHQTQKELQFSRSGNDIIISWPANFKANDLRAIDMLGRSIYHISVQGHTHRASSLPEGAYVILLTSSSGERLIGKLIVR
jgi:hypothetical protein